MSNKPEYVLTCKRFLRLFGLYYFKSDTKLKRCVTNVWMFAITFLFLLTALQALYQQLRKEGFNIARDSPGVVTFCITKILNTTKFSYVIFSRKNGSVLPHDVFFHQPRCFTRFIRLHVGFVSVQLRHWFAGENHEKMGTIEVQSFAFVGDNAYVCVFCGAMATSSQRQVLSKKMSDL